MKMFQQIEIIFSHRKQRISRNQKHHKQDIRGNNKLKRTNAFTFTFQGKIGGEKSKSKVQRKPNAAATSEQKKTYFHTEKKLSDAMQIAVATTTTTKKDKSTQKQQNRLC